MEPVVEAWFPDGPDDPNVALLKFSASAPSTGTAPAAASRSVISFVKSKVTGSVGDVGENAKVNLD